MAKASHVQFYFDIAFPTNVGQALNDAIANFFAGQGTPATIVGVGEPGGRREQVMRTRLELLSFLLAPALVLFGGFVLVPIGVAGFYSLYSWNGFGPLTDFVGLRQLRRRVLRSGLPGRHRAQPGHRACSRSWCSFRSASASRCC